LRANFRGLTLHALPRCLPVEGRVYPARVTVRGAMRVYWNVGTGEISAVFVGVPDVAFEGAIKVAGCGCAPLAPLVRHSLLRSLRRYSQVDDSSEAKAFTAPFTGPVGTQVLSGLMGEDDSENLTSLRGQIRQSTRVLSTLVDPKQSPDRHIPEAILANARALVIMATLGVGFVATGIFGSGVIVKRLADGKWSAPASIATIGAGYGLQIGARKTDTVIVLFTAEAIRTFTSGAQVKLGVNAAVAAGPWGRDVGAGLSGAKDGFTTTFSYSHSQGFYAGYSMEGIGLVHRKQANEEYYGVKGIAVEEILDGEIVPRPSDPDADALYELLAQVTAMDYDPIDGMGPYVPEEFDKDLDEYAKWGQL